MQKKENLWYQVGYALETVRNRLPVSKDPSGNKPTPAEDASHKILDALLTVGAGSVIARVLSLWPSRPGPGIVRLLRAGAAGAAANLLGELVRPALTGKKPDSAVEEKLTDILFTGAGRGLLYASLVEPRIPGPPLLQGAAYGSLEYALTPWGGLGELAGSNAPQGKIPALAILLEDRGADEQLIEHVAFGIALALLYHR